MRGGARVLVVGSGGREDALAWKLEQSFDVQTVFIAPGNGARRSKLVPVPIGALDILEIVKFAQQNAVDLVVIGPEAPLALGLADLLRQAGLRVFGPSRAAARVESSKAYAKLLMKDAGVPTASFHTFTRYDRAVRFVREHGAPVVVKADGLCGGKGSYVCRTVEAAEVALGEIMAEERYGEEAGRQVVIEEFLEGPEASLHAITDGRTALFFPSSRDHKPAYEGDRGPNTGGMGVIAPVPSISRETVEELGEHSVSPILQELLSRGTPFNGCLYPGLMHTIEGPMVLEYNARFGDPETQCYMQLMKSDLFPVLLACAEGRLDEEEVEWHDDVFSVCVVLCSEGYPAKPRAGLPITGVGRAETVHGVAVFHSGTKREGDQLVSSGGRVLAVTAWGQSLKEARDHAYEAAEYINFEGKWCRPDIGAKALELTAS